MDTLKSQWSTLLRRTAGLLEDAQISLKNEVVEACDRLQNPTYRVAVFGPFNYGKSTLLNALLGEKTLPMDLVPTTGAAITVKYGLEHRTLVTYVNGSVQAESGTAALQQFAVLDEQRRMREDVAAVEVYCPHPLLKLGLELVDLPGTDDQQAQNDLMQKQLLSADLVIQLLDGRKLMTLSERENLRDWLLDRGINSVIFVVNFLNLMAQSDRQQVSMRLRFLAESFRTNLPAGVSNLYQVDALPALRARLKGDAAAATQTGLPELESALQTIGSQVATDRPPEQTLPRLKALASRVLPCLQQQIDALAITEPSAADAQRIEIKKKAQRLIQLGFEKDIDKLKTWLTPQNLQAHYRLGLAEALETQQTHHWLLENLKPAWYERQKPVVIWVHQACEFFERSPVADLWMAFEAEPEVEPEAAAAERVEATVISDDDERAGIAPVAIATGLGWVIGGPLGAAVLGGTSHLINQSGGKQSDRKKQPEIATYTAVDFLAQADVYLSRFSAAALSATISYEKAASKVINTELSPPASTLSAAQAAQLNLLTTTAAELCDLISIS